MNRFAYFNDTGKEVSIHPATKFHGTECDMTPIKHLEVRFFEIPKDTYPLVKQWDYGKLGLQILVSPQIIE